MPMQFSPAQNDLLFSEDGEEYEPEEKERILNAQKDREERMRALYLKDEEE